MTVSQNNVRNPHLEHSLNCVVLDAGARYGLHSTWTELERIARFHLFEVDNIEAGRLRAKYAENSNITIHEVALYSERRPLTFSLRQHKGLTSAFHVDPAAVSHFQYMQEEQSTTGEMEVMAQTVDQFFSEAAERIDFFKLDVEGAELEILKGSCRMLSGHVLAVRSEVFFAPLLKKAPLFGDIDAYLRKHGFELLNIDYMGRGHSSCPYTLPSRYGKLLATDGVWVAKKEKILVDDPDVCARRAILFALFLMLNNATDVAIDILQSATERKDIDLGRFDDDPLFWLLRRKVLLLFKELTYLPYMKADDLARAFENIFGAEFPRMHEFFESSMLRR